MPGTPRQEKRTHPKVSSKGPVAKAPGFLRNEATLLLPVFPTRKPSQTAMPHSCPPPPPGEVTREKGKR